MFFSSDLQTALHRAAHYGYTDVCELLIAGKADVNIQNRCTFVFKICFSFCVVLCFRSLLLMLSSSDLQTALHRAAFDGKTALCELLIAGKADVNAKNRCAFVFKMCF
jgi:ankyrin repeat protein